MADIRRHGRNDAGLVTGPPVGPGTPFSLGEPDRLAALVRAAGFADVDVRARRHTLCDSILGRRYVDTTRSLRDCSGRRSMPHRQRRSLRCARQSASLLRGSATASDSLCRAARCSASPASERVSPRRRSSRSGCRGRSGRPSRCRRGTRPRGVQAPFNPAVTSNSASAWLPGIGRGVPHFRAPGQRVHHGDDRRGDARPAEHEPARCSLVGRGVVTATPVPGRPPPKRQRWPSRAVVEPPSARPAGVCVEQPLPAPLHAGSRQPRTSLARCIARPADGDHRLERRGRLHAVASSPVDAVIAIPRWLYAATWLASLPP